MIDNAQLIQDVLDGNEDPLKAYAIIKKQIEYLNKCLSEIKEGALFEAEKHGESNFNHHGFKITYKKGGKYYDYSNIEEIKVLEEKLKNLKAEAINRTKVNDQIVSGSGEILPKPIVKYKQDSLSIK